MLAFRQLAALDDVDSDARVDEADGVNIQVDQLVDFEDILSAVFLTWRVLDQSDFALQFVQPQDIIQSHSLSCLDVVQDDSVFDFTYDHLRHLQ